jgi:hypothetical protein
MRYFFFTYTGTPTRTGYMTFPGTVCISCEDFPNQKDLEIKILEKDNNISKVIITNWQEFKSKHDFLSFMGEID